MIHFVEEATPELLSEWQAFCKDSVFGIKALGPVLSYGLAYDFVSAYEQRNAEGLLTGFLSKYYGTVTVHLSPSADLSEVEGFLQAVGFSALVGSPKALPSFQTQGETGLIMAYSKGADCRVPVAEGEGITLRWNSNLSDFYTVVTGANPGYVSESFDAFLVDFSHRIRHETAVSVLLTEGSVPMATAAALVTMPSAVFLGAVATLPEGRGRHYASTCLSALCSRFPDRKVFLLCKPEKQKFYEHLGMHTEGTYLELFSSRK